MLAYLNSVVMVSLSVNSPNDTTDIFDMCPFSSHTAQAAVSPGTCCVGLDIYKIHRPWSYILVNSPIFKAVTSETIRNNLCIVISGYFYAVEQENLLGRSVVHLFFLLIDFFSSSEGI